MLRILDIFGKLAERGIPALESGLSANDSSIRSQSAWVISLHPNLPHKIIVPILIKAVLDSDFRTRHWSLNALKNYKEKAGPAVPALEIYLQKFIVECTDTIDPIQVLIAINTPQSKKLLGKYKNSYPKGCF